MNSEAAELGLNLPTLIAAVAIFFLALPGLAYLGWKIQETLQDGGGARIDIVRPFDIIPATFLANMYLLLWVLSFVSWLTMPEPEKPPELSYVGILLQLAIMAVILFAILALIWWRGVPPWQFFGLDAAGFLTVLTRTGLFLAAALFPLLLVGLLWNLALSLIEGIDTSPQDVVQLFIRSDNPFDRIILTVFAVVVAPLSEELIFRGYIYQVAKRYLTFVPAMLLVSVLFAMIHFSLPALAPLFLLAIILTLSYERTGSIITPILIHAVFNGVMVLQMWFIDPSQLPSS